MKRLARILFIASVFLIELAALLFLDFDIQTTSEIVPSGSPTLMVGATSTSTPVVLAGQPFVIEDISAQDGRLPLQLRAGAQHAAELDLHAYAFFTAEWCENCQEIEKSLRDPDAADIFQGTYIMRLDLDVWREQSGEAGMFVVGVPAFYEIGADGRATGRSLIGGVANTVPSGQPAMTLKDFFQGN